MCSRQKGGRVSLLGIPSHRNRECVQRLELVLLPWHVDTPLRGHKRCDERLDWERRDAGGRESGEMGSGEGGRWKRASDNVVSGKRADLLEDACTSSCCRHGEKHSGSHKPQEAPSNQELNAGSRRIQYAVLFQREEEGKGKGAITLLRLGGSLLARPASTEPYISRTPDAPSGDIDDDDFTRYLN